MTDAEALHTATRRYCLERIDQWHRRYEELGPPDYERGYSDRHKDVFPRYNVLAAVLVEVERLRAEQLVDFQDACNQLGSVGRTVHDAFPEDPKDAIEQRAAQEELDLFTSFVDGLDATTLAEVAPLPYRRTLLEAESQVVWDRLKQRFGLGEHPFWFPLHGDRPPDTAAFEAGAFYERFGAAGLRGILAQEGVTRLWELREFGAEYELDLCLVEPSYNGAEGYWTANDMDWLVYASHESTITVSGAALLERLRTRWPAWAAHQIDW
jgi:hypothetical protein